MKNKLLAIALILLLTLTACSSGPKEVTDMAYTVEICGKSFSGTYTGTTLEDLPNGTGTFTVDTSRESLTYTGQWENGAIVSTGELEYDGYKLEYNDTEYTGIYSGQTKNGMPNGEGTFEGAKRDNYLVYEGSWKDGAFAGEGYVEANEFAVDVGDGIIKKGTFEGNVLDGVPTGEGNYSATNSQGVDYTYTGEWKNGQFNGNGITVYDHEDSYIYKGNYTNSNFTPTPAEFYATHGTWQKSKYTIIPAAVEFLEKYPNIFLNNSVEGIDVEYDKQFKFKDFAKSQESYGDKLITVSMRVVQLLEREYWGINATRCIGRDGSGNFYYMFMYGSAEGIYDNSWIKATMLPLDYFTYKTVDNRDNWAMAAAAVTITK